MWQRNYRNIRVTLGEILACLLLGVIIVSAICWKGVSDRSECVLKGWNYSIDDRRPVVWGTRSTLFRQDIQCTYTSVAESIDFVLQNGERYSDSRLNAKRAPSWARIGAPSGERVTWWGSTAVGWPARCLTLHWYCGDVGLVLQDAIPMRQGDDHVPPAGMPLRIIVSGGVFNAAVFATALMTLLLCVRAVRVYHRRKRRCCTACGYDVRSISVVYVSKCPECGTER
jgi:hypothetical protein